MSPCWRERTWSAGRRSLLDATVADLAAAGARPGRRRRAAPPSPGDPGSTVSLLPFGGDVDGVTTAGLVYPLADEPLALGSARGVSNVDRPAGASVTVRRGLLLVVESPATL